MCNYPKPKYEIGDLLEISGKRFGIVMQIDIAILEQKNTLRYIIEYRIHFGGSEGNWSNFQENMVNRRLEHANQIK